MKNSIIHGDVKLESISQIPSNFKKLEKPEMRNGCVVVQHGEHSNHFHVIEKQKHGEVEVYQDEKQNMIIKIGVVPAIIRHEEHASLILEPGIYTRKIETEYDPFKKVTQEVID